MIIPAVGVHFLLPDPSAAGLDPRPVESGPDGRVHCPNCGHWVVQLGEDGHVAKRRGRHEGGPSRDEEDADMIGHAFRCRRCNAMYVVLPLRQTEKFWRNLGRKLARREAELER